MIISTTSRALLISALFLGLVVSPYSAAASHTSSSARPACELTVSTSKGTVDIGVEGEVLVNEGDYLALTWESKNAKEAVDERTDDEIALSGTATTTPTRTTTYEYTFSSGSRNATCEVKATVAKAAIDLPTFSSNTTKPVIKGTASGTSYVSLSIYKEGTSKAYYESKPVRVSKGRYSITLPKALTEGTYEFRLSGDKKLELNRMVTSKYVVSSTGTTPVVASTLVVSPVPLLFGGSARPGQSVAISYLQVTNIGAASSTIKGFWVKQNGSAPDTAFIGLSTVDDRGGSRGATGGVEGMTPFKNRVAYAPTLATLAPEEMKLFTIKASMSAHAAIHAGTLLDIDVTGVDADVSLRGTFPIDGTFFTVASF